MSFAITERERQEMEMKRKKVKRERRLQMKNEEYRQLEEEVKFLKLELRQLKHDNPQGCIFILLVALSKLHFNPFIPAAQYRYFRKQCRSRLDGS